MRARLPNIGSEPSQSVPETMFSIESLTLISPVGEWWVVGCQFVKSDPTTKMWFVNSPQRSGEHDD